MSDNLQQQTNCTIMQAPSKSVVILAPQPTNAPSPSSSSLSPSSQKQTTYATSPVMPNVSCVHVTRDTGKKRAADNNMRQLVHAKKTNRKSEQFG